MPDVEKSCEFACPTSFFNQSMVETFLQDKEQNRVEIATWLYEEMESSLILTTEFYSTFRPHQPMAASLQFVKTSLNDLLNFLKPYLSENHPGHQTEHKSALEFNHILFNQREIDDVNRLITKISLYIFKEINTRKKILGSKQLDNLGKKFIHKYLYEPAQAGLHKNSIAKLLTKKINSGAFC